MKVDKDTVDKIAHLARLEFGEDEKKDMIQDMNNMLAFVEKLNELDTENLEPLIFMSDEVNVLRPDVVKHEITHQQALQNAPAKDSDYFKAPKVLGE